VTDTKPPRCPDCDDPLATQEDADRHDAKVGECRPVDDCWCEKLCWREWTDAVCMGEEVNWRSRALAAEAERDAALARAERLEAALDQIESLSDEYSVAQTAIARAALVADLGVTHTIAVPSGNGPARRRKMSEEQIWYIQSVESAFCPSCDRRLATAGDISRHDADKCADDCWCRQLCWSPLTGNCEGEPVDWRSRALAAGEALRACRAALMRVDIAKPDAVGDAQQAWADAIALADAALEEKS